MQLKKKQQQQFEQDKLIEKSMQSPTNLNKSNSCKNSVTSNKSSITSKKDEKLMNKLMNNSNSRIE